jgi:rhodanese-related sulfurtransferase
MPVHVPNLRDVGGVGTDDGRRVRTGLLLRSAQPAADDLVPADFEWPPSVVIDLRSPLEASDEHPLGPLGARVINLPLLEALRPHANHDRSLADLYKHVNDTASHLLVDLVQTVADADGPVLVHCAAGKDRTGIAVALVLRLLGVDQGQVVADYLLTNDHTEAIDARLGRSYAAPSVPRAYFEVVPEALVEVMEVWDAHPGGVEGWFLAAGGSAESIERLRSRFLEPVA